MTKQIRTVTVIGAGTMGGGIAAHLANAGIKVHLLDRVPEGAEDRNILAKEKVAKMKKVVNPMSDILNAGFMHPSNADRITIGNSEDDLAQAVQDSDWVIEAIPDKTEWKQALFEKIETHLKEGAVVSSNTSTIPLKNLVQGRSDSFKKNFMITHFFNPPRFMHFLETVVGPETSKETAKLIEDFCDVKLGKHVERCPDTPLFKGNRMGMYVVTRAMTAAMEQDIGPEEVDAMLSRPFGMGDAGIFGMVDMVGLGLVPDLVKNAANLLQDHDAFHKLDHKKVRHFVEDLIDRGFTGRAGGGGFFRPKKDENGKTVKDKKGKTILQVIDFETGEYRDQRSTKLKAAQKGKMGPRAVLEHGDKYSDFAWTVVRDTLLYALARVPEISKSIEGIDVSMRHGYNWKQGPFELLDKIGVKYFTERLKKDGIEPPKLLKMMNGRNFYSHDKNWEKQKCDFDFVRNFTVYTPVTKQDGVLNLADIKRASDPVVTHKSASTWDIGDGVLCLEYHSKMNAMDPSILHVMNETVKTINNSNGKYKAMVIYNDAKNFSLGANLKLIEVFKQAADHTRSYAPWLAKKIEHKMFEFADNFAYIGQPVFKALRESPFPVVGAPSGMAWGGGAESILHCDAIQANAETSIGLVEGGVGLIPGWGGNLRLLERMQMRMEYADKGPFVPLEKTFRAIAMPIESVSTSAQDAVHKGWLRPGIDGITMNPDRLLADAKAKALSMVDGYKPPEAAKLHLPGALSKTAFKTAVDSFYIAGTATWYDVVVADALSDTLSGGDDAHIGKTITENEFLHRERENFSSLIHTPQTLKRIQHMLKHNKPLREGPLKTVATLDEIRAMRKEITLPQRPLTDRPLEGEEAQTLKRMADFTAALIDANDKKGMSGIKNLIHALG